MTFAEYNKFIEEKKNAFKADLSAYGYRQALEDLRVIPDTVPVFCNKEELEKLIQQADIFEICSEGEFHKLVYITNFGQSPFYAVYLEDLKPLTS